MNNTRKQLTKYVIAFIVITGLSCAAAVVAPFVALIGAKNWVDKTVPQDAHHFNFFSLTSEDSNYSKFEGNETDPTLGSQHFTGFYSNHDIQFTYDSTDDAARANKTYKGTVNDASTEMTLKGTDAVDPLPAVTLNTN